MAKFSCVISDNPKKNGMGYETITTSMHGKHCASQWRFSPVLFDRLFSRGFRALRRSQHCMNWEPDFEGFLHPCFVFKLPASSFFCTMFRFFCGSQNDLLIY